MQHSGGMQYFSCRENIILYSEGTNKSPVETAKIKPLSFRIAISYSQKLLHQRYSLLKHFLKTQTVMEIVERKLKFSLPCGDNSLLQLTNHIARTNTCRLPKICSHKRNLSNQLFLETPTNNERNIIPNSLWFILINARSYKYYFTFLT